MYGNNYTEYITQRLFIWCVNFVDTIISYLGCQNSTRYPAGLTGPCGLTPVKVRFEISIRYLYEISSKFHGIFTLYKIGMYAFV